MRPGGGRRTGRRGVAWLGPEDGGKACGTVPLAYAQGMAGDGTRHVFPHTAVAVTMTALLLVPALSGCRQAPPQLRSGECKPGDPLAGVYIPSRLAVKNAC